MKSINKAVEISAPTMRSALKRNSMRFAAALLVALASFVAVPNATLAAGPQHHDQVPGFYRMKIGDFEVTALFDGHAVFDPHWLNGTKAMMDDVAEALHEDPHMLDVSDEGFLVNTGTQLVLVDAGAGSWWGGGALGRLVGSLRSAGYTPEEVNIVLLTHLHSDHVGGLTTQDGKRVFPNADVYVAKAESSFWLSPEIAAKATKDAQPFFQSAQAIAAPYTHSRTVALRLAENTPHTIDIPDFPSRIHPLVLLHFYHPPPRRCATHYAYQEQSHNTLILIVRCRGCGPRCVSDTLPAYNIRQHFPLA